MGETVSATDRDCEDSPHDARGIRDDAPRGICSKSNGFFAMKNVTHPERTALNRSSAYWRNGAKETKE
jgi:hypothetical protein